METIQLNGVNSIKGEINAILTMMRVNTRWSNVKIRVNKLSENNMPLFDKELDSFEENPLVGPFRRLNRYLEGGLFDLKAVDIVTYISPFHNIIVSEQASGPLTSAALGSLVKFVSYGFLSSEFPRAKEGIALIANCISRCIFEETDWESDEVILMKLLELSTLVYRCDAAKLLSVGSAWEIYSTCISIYSQYRASKILKSEAESALRNLTLTAFSRANLSTKLSTLDIEEEDADNLADDNDHGFSQIMRDKTWESASNNYDFDGPVGIPLLLGKIMTVLSGLMDLQSQPVQGVRFSLALVNIALEAGGPSLGSIPVLVEILRGDICRHLLKASQSDNLEIFSLTLRVVFNLFMSIKDHVKIQLEVFLTSVHLRLLSVSQQSAISLAREELALESLLEYCREPSLMQDIYTNYDCDVQCTNLYDAIVTTLCQRSLPYGFILSSSANSHLSESDALTFNIDVDVEMMTKKGCPGMSILNKLALDGVLSIIHALYSRCQALENEKKIAQQRPSIRRDYSWSSAESINSAVSSPEKQSLVDVQALLTPTKNLETSFLDKSNESQYSESPRLDNNAVEGNNESNQSVVITERSSFAVRQDTTSSPMVNDDSKTNGNLNNLFSQVNGDQNSMLSDCEADSADESRPQYLADDDDQDFVYHARAKTAEILRQRKLKKQRLKVAADKFNISPLKTEWIRYSLDCGLLTSAGLTTIDQMTFKNMSNEDILNACDPNVIGRFLRNTPGLGKTQIGEFISKGPANLYPFHAAVLRAYVDTFEFFGKYSSFPKALRLFLGHFRLPGEAQCIDRIMEAFAGKLYRDLGPGKPFKSSDSAFILSFSTIMLNTDLHNPGIPVNKKMTKEQFVRNNRGINDGEDLPRDFLELMYDEIKTNPIQVDADISDPGSSSISHFDFSDPAAWNKLIKNRSSKNAPAVFTPTVAAREVATIAAVSRNSVNQLQLAPIDEDSKRARSNSAAVASRYLLPITHEKDMFLVMANQVFESLMILWTYVEDDSIVNKLLDGTSDFIQICIHLNLPVMFDGLVKILATRTISIIEYEKIGHKSWSAKQKKLKTEKRASWDDYYDTASMIAADEINNSVISKYTASIYRESLERILASKFEQIIQNSAHSNSLTNASPLSWQGSCKIRGELVMKMLLYFVEEYTNLLSYEGWASLVAIMLYSRSLGVLPPPLAIIRDTFEIPSSPDSPKLVMRLPLTINGECFLEGSIRYMKTNSVQPSVKKSKPETNMPSSSKGVNQLPSRDTVPNPTSGSSFWGSLGSYIWSSKPEATSNSSSRFDMEAKVNSGNFSKDILTLSELSDVISNKHPLPGLSNPIYRIIDGNCQQKRKDDSDMFDKTESNLEFLSPLPGVDDMLKVVLLSSHLDRLIFISSSVERVVTLVFDALAKYLVDVLDIILAADISNVHEVEQPDNNLAKSPSKGESSESDNSSNNYHVFTLIHGQSDAVMLLEWIFTIIEANPSHAQLLWSKLHKGFLSVVFEAELLKISTKAPFLLERAVALILRAGTVFFPLELSSSQSSFQSTNLRARSMYNSPDTSIWASLRLIRLVSPATMMEIGGHVGAGLLTLLKLYPVLKIFDSSDKWTIFLSIASAAANNSIGRVFTWEILNHLLDSSLVNSSNITLLRNLNFQFLLGEFDQPDSLTRHDFSSKILQIAPLDRSIPWIPMAIMHLLKLTLNVLLAGQNLQFYDTSDLNSIDSELQNCCISYPLPFWPHDHIPSSRNLNLKTEVTVPQTKRHASLSFDKPKVMYSATSELKHKRMQDMRDPEAKLFSPSHILVNPIAIGDANYSESLWRESSVLMARLVGLGDNHVVSRRALLGLQVLIDCGKRISLAVQSWWILLVDIVQLLPMSLLQFPSKYEASENQSISEDERICLQSCNIVFTLIISRIKDFRKYDTFHMLWIKFLEALSGNLKLGVKSSEYFKKEILEMLSALLRLLQPSVRSSPMKPGLQGPLLSPGGSHASNISAPNPSIPVKDSTLHGTSRVNQSNQPVPRVDNQSKGVGFFGYLFGFGGSGSSVANQFQRDASSEAVSEHTELPVDPSQPSIDIVATASASATLTAKAVISDEDPLLTLDSTIVTPTKCDLTIAPVKDSESKGLLLSASRGPSQLELENEKLLLATWKSITTVCVGLPNLLKSHNSQFINDLQKSLEDAHYRASETAENSSQLTSSSSTGTSLQYQGISTPVTKPHRNPDVSNRDPPKTLTNESHSPALSMHESNGVPPITPSPLLKNLLPAPDISPPQTHESRLASPSTGRTNGQSMKRGGLAPSTKVQIV